jgi:hypothetical protein
MSPPPAAGDAPGDKGPLVPPLPSIGRRGGRRKANADRRWLLWLGALVLGIALGVGGYRLIKPIATYFDYWVAVALS